MMTTKLIITRKRGDTNRIIGIVVDSNDEIVNISDWSNFAMTVDSKPNPIDNSTAVVSTVGGLVTDGRDGAFYILIDGTMAIGNYFYDIQCTDSNDEIYTIMEGGYIVTQDRTK